MIKYMYMFLTTIFQNLNDKLVQTNHRFTSTFYIFKRFFVITVLNFEFSNPLLNLTPTLDHHTENFFRLVQVDLYPLVLVCFQIYEHLKTHKLCSIISLNSCLLFFPKLIFLYERFGVNIKYFY